MKSLKMASYLALATVMAFSLPLRKKENHFFSKEEMAGSWSSTITTAGSSVAIKIQLKNSDSLEIENAPFDGIPEFTGTWELEGNHFIAKTSFVNDPEHVLFEGIVDFPNLVMKPRNVSREMDFLTRSFSQKTNL